ncbi:OST-HTH/LOTUS domain-containing protein [Lysobacter sp. ESA13C]|uniref:OST-HTH/LOTUS domain-containing protein n=1 Tax=Lysobacter sp. ESA13C TaxID=2862676 RepID=UPI001CC11AFB|nr:OST-HTH/LOTUS domain-containing protein [Lysobacter sp. ESA13C]
MTSQPVVDLEKKAPIDIALAQERVQRTFGRCILRLQQYERLMKVIVAHYELSGPASELQNVKQARIEAAAKNTLGSLVGQLIGGLIVNGDAEQADVATDSVSGVSSVSFRASLSLSATDFDRTRASLKDLVGLRNDLVHHFVENFDLRTLEGCEHALAHLQEADARIEQHYAELRSWAIEVDQARAMTLAFLQSEAGIDLIVNGIAPDGSIDWRASGIVNVLHEAAGALAINGWAPLGTAIAWIRDRYPVQQPMKYGCSSWRQVLHESKCFEWCYRSAVNGKRDAWYKSR